MEDIIYWLIPYRLIRANEPMENYLNTWNSLLEHLNIWFPSARRPMFREFNLTILRSFASMARMLMIRLQRIGRTNSPHFRVVVTDKRNSPKSRNFVEIIGSYAAKEGKFAVNGERAKYWISQGALVSDTMHNFLVSEKVITGKKINVLPSKHPIKRAPTEAKGGEGKEEAKDEEAKPEAPAEAALAA